MAYTPTNWTDRVVDRPRTYQLQDNGDGTFTLIPAPGTVYSEGTKVVAAIMNKIEQGIKDAHDTADGALQRSGGTMTGNLDIDKIDPSISLSHNGILKARFYYLGGDDALYLFRMDGGTFRGGLRFKADNTIEAYSGAGYHRIWDQGQLRYNNGMLEVNVGGVWTPVGGIKSIQKGKTELTSGAAYTDVTISAVNVNKSVPRLLSSVAATGTGSTPTLYTLSLELVNPTTLRIHNPYQPSYTGTVSWAVEEYY